MSTSYNNQQIPTIYVGYNPNSGQPMPTAPAPIQPPLRLSWYQMQQKNKPQGNALAPGLMILLSGGLHFAWGVLRYHFDEKWAPQHASFRDMSHMKISFLIGVLIGGIPSTLLVRKIEKKFFYYASSVLNLAGAIIFIVHNDDYRGTVSARYLIGAGFGFTFIPLLIHAAEIGVKEIRGLIISSLNFLWIFGFLISAIFLTVIENNSTPDSRSIIDRTIGIVTIIWSVLGGLLTPFVSYESPVYLITKDQAQKAKIMMMKLRNDTVETRELIRDFNEMTIMVAEEIRQSSSIFLNKNVAPLLRIALLRGLYAISICAPINYSMIEMAKAFFIDINGPKKFSAIILIGSRLVCEFICYVGIDRFGRRKLLFISAGLGGIVLIIIGSLYVEKVDMGSFGILSLFYEIFVGFGLGAVSLTYMAEAFPIKKNPFSLLFIMVFEIILHVISIIVYLDVDFDGYFKEFMFVTGGAQIISCLYLYIVMPETNQMPLRECHNKMR